MSDEEFPKPEKPYFLTYELDAKLRQELTEAQDLSPGMLDAYKQTEQYLGQQFVALYGDMMGLSEEQRLYMQEQRIMVVKPETLLAFNNAWNRPLHLKKEEASLNGYIYTAYRPKTAPSVVNRTDVHQDISFIGGQHMWHGRVPVYSVQPMIQDVTIRPDYLDFRVLQEQPYPPEASIAERMRIDMERFTQYQASFRFATEAMHEKVHGLENPDIPSPIREAYTYYLQETFSAKVCNLPISISPCHDASIFMGELLEKYGPDIHKLLTGNLLDKRKAKELLQQIKEEFTPETIERIYPTMEWIKIPTDETI